VVSTKTVALTRLEFNLLHCAQHHGHAVATAADPVRRSLGYEPDDDVETMRAPHLRHRRTKLEPDSRKPRFIQNGVASWYCLELPPDSDPSSLIPPPLLEPCPRALIQVVLGLSNGPCLWRRLQRFQCVFRDWQAPVRF